MLSVDQLVAIDRNHCWHPYSAVPAALAPWPVVGASGVRLRLADGRELIDGMASWWCAIHGYNHPRLNQALREQLERMAHVMFGGLTHEPACRLVERLVALSPPGLDKVFLADSGSVSVEVAIKMAIQYWQARGQPAKRRLITVRNGYHGDTLGAMSVCDPVTGMHHLFAAVLPQQVFAPAPPAGFHRPPQDEDTAELRRLFERHHAELAAMIIEPVVQGAGGMRIYAPAYLARVRALCDEFEVLLIADEIATGFGRSGALFACEHAGVSPDIMTVGKALTGGYLTLAATLCTARVAEGICAAEPGVFMHGPTFMANPLACAAANASIELLLEGDWRTAVAGIQRVFEQEWAAARELSAVADVRALGAICVIELREPVDMARIQQRLVDAGIWLRPFGKLVYAMPPYLIGEEDLRFLCRRTLGVLRKLYA